MKIIICGAAGRMGQAILSVAKADENVQVVGAFEYDGSSAIGSGTPRVAPISDLEKVLPQADALIDFTSPDSALKNLKAAKKYKIPVVIGTTGFIDEQKNEIAEIAKSIPVVMSPNMSIGVNLLFKLVDEVAKKIPDYDIEIVELHHNKKKDAPSGTAAKLAEVAAKGIGKKIESVGVYGRHGIIGTRNQDEIGVMSVRAGDIVGDHTVYFAGPGERIELTHRAHSRDTFAAGAVRAAKWLKGKQPGLYDMQDVLELK
ncbi:4-hydroxy-tetrahydrodipicolinate reductase [Endomicrobium proavitum]|uniref:4-hydroxy-tetrahydrodipicolinate reductase n=2 Tax=Endomicrobium proavitum TaxID=1408281 RepID=A0A0G3WKW3_9BACT|nr:4-hydroxy-tetrahydrodipicolinate reductase [Endomicrobium proavitum]